MVNSFLLATDTVSTCLKVSKLYPAVFVNMTITLYYIADFASAKQKFRYVRYVVNEAFRKYKITTSMDIILLAYILVTMYSHFITELWNMRNMPKIVQESLNELLYICFHLVYDMKLAEPKHNAFINGTEEFAKNFLPDNFEHEDVAKNGSHAFIAFKLLHEYAATIRKRDNQKNAVKKMLLQISKAFEPIPAEMQANLQSIVTFCDASLWETSDRVELPTSTELPSSANIYGDLYALLASYSQFSLKFTLASSKADVKHFVEAVSVSFIFNFTNIVLWTCSCFWT